MRQQHKNYSAFPSDSYGIFYITTRLKPTGAAYFPNGYLRGGTNPAVLVQDLTGYDRTTINTINTTLTANWDLGSITKGLSVSGTMAYDVIGNFQKNWQKNWQYYTYDEVTELYEERTNSYWSTPVLHEYQRNSNTLTVNANINYDRDFNGHHVSALAGFEQASYRLDYMGAGINKYDSTSLTSSSPGRRTRIGTASKAMRERRPEEAGSGDLGYDWKSRYLPSGHRTFRRFGKLP